MFSTAYLPHIGGSELAIQHIADHIPQFDIDLVTGKLDGSDATMEQIGRIRVFRAGGRWSRLTLVLPKLLMPLAMAVTALRLTRRHSYALMHAYQASQAAVAASIVKIVRPSLPLIVTLQEGKDLKRQSWLTRRIRKFIIRRADTVTAISRYLADIAREYTSVPIKIIPNGVDINAMKFPETTRKPHAVVTVSRLVEKNNVGNLIRAIAIVRDTLPDVHLSIIGSGRLRGELERCVSDLGISNAIDFIGSVPHHRLGEFLGSASVFARPSLSEGLGSAFLEAMAARLPVVASAVGGIPDIVHEGSTGLLCNPENPDDIARAITRLLTDMELRNHIIGTAYQFVQRYDWTVIAKDMAAVYDSYISPR